jgi:hypothetical protein
MVRGFRSSESLRMDPPVAFPTEGDEILFAAITQLTSRSDVVNFESHT